LYIYAVFDSHGERIATCPQPSAVGESQEPISWRVTHLHEEDA
jgi:hypothetical protein